uniref:vWA domain-containing protein n=1 Tax=Candidatus Scatousia sp. TaxID=3085663 RepID=UPI0040252216
MQSLVKIFILFNVFILFGACLTVQAFDRQPVNFTKIDYSDYYNHRNIVMILLDTSDSMSSGIEMAKDTAKSLLPEISQHNELGLRTFGGHCGSNLHSKPKYRNTAKIIEGLDAATPYGQTPIKKTLEETVNNDFFHSQLKKKIILITDGSDTCGGNPCEYIKKLSKVRKDIIIDVILIGNNDRLKCLSDATNGTFYSVTSKESFTNALKEIIKLKQNYTECLCRKIYFLSFFMKFSILPTASFKFSKEYA